MKTGTALLMAVTLMGTAFSAAAQNTSSGVSAKGEGPWEVLCQGIVRGNMKYFQLDQNHGAFSEPRLASAECKYRAASAGALAISVTGPQECPFSGASADACTITMDAGKSGSFKFSAKR